MNRITRFIHKAQFLSRQRHIIDYNHKYVITADDVKWHERKALKTYEAKVSEAETAKMIDDLVRYFDPENN